MTAHSTKTFRTTLVPSGMGLQSSFAILPFDIAKAWPGMKVRRVKGEINGFAFQTALFPTPKGHGFIVNKKMLAGAGLRQGDRAEIRVEPDLEPRKEAVPEELLRAMKGAAGLRKWFEKLPAGHRRWISHIVSEPKSAASRQKRAEEMAERLYLTMEGELETPPILRAAFQRQPLAEAGWKALTPIQRRNNLFMVFGCRSAETREKRVQAAIDTALNKSRGGSGNSRSERSAMRSDWDRDTWEV
ncbi:YdeI/OmpD-associated family protein [Occallatibacter riparius]|uniref:YdeI/OmpD-associated family protein n=1 Tax=Occallatibacter riparius TaxID=1002689 RepID=A0A9J7BQ32_9BACT|nr:YdeI/OmpD-associated family protein [Occallatibacter riparius]UWZ84988.1 YdeI/OmpD-associated family protein [Occallatibacter riparius]